MRETALKELYSDYLADSVISKTQLQLTIPDYPLLTETTTSTRYTHEDNASDLLAYPYL